MTCIASGSLDFSRASVSENNKAIQLGKSKSLSHVKPSDHYRHIADRQPSLKKEKNADNVNATGMN
jgi:hypothetical protein